MPYLAAAHLLPRDQKVHLTLNTQDQPLQTVFLLQGGPETGLGDGEERNAVWSPFPIIVLCGILCLEGLL